MKRALLGAMTAILAAGASPAVAREAPAVYRCGEVRGVQLSAPSWDAQAEAIEGATVLLRYAGNGLQATVQWSNSPHEYAGFGFAMREGFAVVVIAEEFIETYALNEADREVMVTMVRSGSASFPNSSKAFRGTCQPTG